MKMISSEMMEMEMMGFKPNPYDSNEITVAYKGNVILNDVEVGDVYNIEGRRYRVSKIRQFEDTYHLTMIKDNNESGDD